MEWRQSGPSRRLESTTAGCKRLPNHFSMIGVCVCVCQNGQLVVDGVRRSFRHEASQSNGGSGSLKRRNIHLQCSREACSNALSRLFLLVFLGLRTEVFSLTFLGLRPSRNRTEPWWDSVRFSCNAIAVIVGCEYVNSKYQLCFLLLSGNLFLSRMVAMLYGLPVKW